MADRPLKLFTGSACFSPAVHREDLLSWAAWGGTIARSEEERRNAKYYFCSGQVDDPWVKILSDKSLLVRSLWSSDVYGLTIRLAQVFDASWIAQAVKERFCISMSPYVLDGRAAPLPMKRAIQGRQATHRVTAAPPALQQTTTSRPTPESRGPEMGTRPARSKRQIDQMDSPDSAPRPAKRTRPNTPPFPMSIAAIGGDRSPKRPIAGQEPSLDDNRNVLRVDLAATKRPTQLSRISSLHIISLNADTVAIKPDAPSPTPGFFDMIYSKAPDTSQTRGPLRFTIDDVKALGGVSTLETRIFEKGARHLGEEFHVWSTNNHTASLVPPPRPMAF
ncbi:hypothetical protein OF83DRAFT_388938 [Amylostereum chailletii]|nr:hypothetical protein OF83DRAFT_388938 [Amylostereum chailletii]